MDKAWIKGNGISCANPWCRQSLLCCNPNFWSIIFEQFFEELHLMRIIFVCKEEEDTGSAGEQPDSNTLYGYTAKGKAFGSSFLSCRHPLIAKKTQCLSLR